MFGYLVLAGTMIVCSNTAPQPQGKGRYGAKGGYFFEGKLDGVQGALHDIETAGKVLATLEGQLEKLNTNSGNILKAEIAIEKGIATADINNSWNGGGGDTDCEDIFPSACADNEMVRSRGCAGLGTMNFCKHAWRNVCGTVIPGSVEDTCRKSCQNCGE